MSSDALNPEPVTELPLTPPAEEDEVDAAIELKEKKNNRHKIKHVVLLSPPLLTCSTQVW